MDSHIDGANLSSMTVQELRQIAQKYDLAIGGRATKAQLVALIQKELQKTINSPKQTKHVTIEATNMQTPQKSIPASVFDDSPTPVKVYSRGNTPIAIDSPIAEIPETPAPRVSSPSIRERIPSPILKKPTNNPIEMKKEVFLLIWLVILIISIIAIFLLQ